MNKKREKWDRKRKLILRGSAKSLVCNHSLGLWQPKLLPLWPGPQPLIWLEFPTVSSTWIFHHPIIFFLSLSLPTVRKIYIYSFLKRIFRSHNWNMMMFLTIWKDNLSYESVENIYIYTFYFGWMWKIKCTYFSKLIGCFISKIFFI